MLTNTSRLSLPYLYASQADKHVFVNEALSKLDTLTQLCVTSQGLSQPPALVAEGQSYILGATPLFGAWSGSASGRIMSYVNAQWNELVPKSGWLAFIEDEGRFRVWTGTQWTEINDLIGETSRRNLLINSAFEVWQRGDTHTLQANQSFLTADRWRCSVGQSGAVTVSKVQLSASSGAPTWVRNSLRVQQTSPSNTGTLIEQRIEDVTTLFGQTMTFSFWARASKSLSILPKVAQSFGTGGSTTVSSMATAIELSTNWARYVVRLEVGALGNATIGNNSFLSVGLVGPVDQTFWFELALPSCEAGAYPSIPTKPVPGETLRQCFRYFCKTFPASTAPASNTLDIGGPFESAYSNIAYGNLMSWQFPEVMRKSPTITTYNPYSVGASGLAIAGSGNYAVDVYGLTEMGVLLRNTQALAFAPTPVNLHVTADAEL